MAEHATQEGGVRGPADVSTLLIELGRALKACRFYPPEHPARKATLDRSFRAWQSELARCGALELEIKQSAFRLAGTREAVGQGSLEDLVREFVHRAVRSIRFEPELGAEDFAALVSLLAMDPDQVEEAGGIEHALYATVRGGITLNQVDYRALLEREKAAASEPAPEPSPDDEDLPAPKGQITDVDPLAALGGLLQRPGTEVEDGALLPEPEPDRGAELVALLRILDECRDDVRYGELLQQIASEAAALADGCHADDAYRAILVVSAHAIDGARSERQRTLAEEALFQLASGSRLDDVVHRACATGPTASVRATQILLHLGAHAVPQLFDALLLEPEPERRGQLNAILIAMGEKATPEVKRSLDSGDPARARLAARMAGEMQNPAVVPYLRSVLRSADAPLELQKEVAKALLRIGSAAATQTLIEGVSSTRAEVAAVAAHCLGSTGSARALEALLGALRRAIREDQLELAREAIRALGRLGRGEAVPTLSSILERRSLLGRKRLRELKLAAAAALGRVPGDQARTCLERCAVARGDAQVRRAARTALERHGEP